MKTTTFGGITREQHDAIQHTSAMIADGTITNADISPSAAIAYAKLLLTGSIMDADINPDAAIASSKIAFAVDPGAHASRHATGGADALPNNAITDAMLAFSIWKQIANIPISTNTDYIDFTGLDVNTDKTYVMVLILKNPTASNCDYRLYVENDYTNTNYYVENFLADGTSFGGSRDNLPAIYYLPSGQSGTGIAFIDRDPAGYPRFTSIANKLGGSSVQFGIRAVTKTATVTNITTLRLSASVAGGIGSGSYVGLFKVKTQ